MAKHRNVRTGHLGHISAQSNSYFTPRSEVFHVPFFRLSFCQFYLLACREPEFVLYRGYFEIKVYCILKMGFSFHRGLVYDVLWWVYGCVWSHMVIGDVMSHALVYIEIGNSLNFPLEVVYMGSETHIKSVLYK